MKNTLLLTLVALSLALGVAVPTALAQDDTYVAEQRMEKRQETKQQVREEVTKNIQERKAERLENAEEMQEKREEVRDDITRIHADRLSKRFGFYYRRLAGIITKVESRLAIMTQEGIDVTQAQVKLSEAKKSLEDAKSYADQAIAAFLEIEPTEYRAQNDLALAAQDLAQQAREKFKVTAVLIREAVQLAKSAQ